MGWRSVYVPYRILGTERIGDGPKDIGTVRTLSVAMTASSRSRIHCRPAPRTGSPSNRLAIRFWRRGASPGVAVLHASHMR